MWCISCGEEVRTVNNTHQVFDTEWRDVYICDGPFTQCPPPPITEQDWDAIFANEPSPEEFALMEQEAESLIEN